MANTPSFLIGGSAQGNNLGTALENQTTAVVGQLQVGDIDGLSNPNFKILGAPENGTATLDAEGNWTYVPYPDFSGSDKFLVVLKDDAGFSSTHYVQVEVVGTGANNGIDAIDDVANVVIGSTTAIDVLANDTFTAATAVTKINGQNIVEGGSVTLKDAAGNVTGTVSLVDGQLSFKAGTLAGNVSFNYTATNSYGVSETATVSVNVEGRNPPAYTTGGETGVGYAGDAATGTATGTLTVGDLNGITNPQFTIFAQGNQGVGSVATIDPVTGVWTYTAPVGSKETFIVKVTDDIGNVSTVGVTGQIVAGTDPLSAAQKPEGSLNSVDALLDDEVVSSEATPAESVVLTTTYVAPLEDATSYVA